MGVSPPASEEARESDSKLSILVSILPSEDVCPIHSPPPKEKKPEPKPEPDPQLLKILDPEDMCHVHSRFCKPEIANTATVKEEPKPDPQLLEILDPEDMCQVHCRLPKPEPAKTPVPEKPDIRNKWFTAIDVEKHNSVYDLYVSIYGKVYDLTNLITRHHHALAKVSIPSSILVRIATEIEVLFFDFSHNFLIVELFTSVPFCEIISIHGTRERYLRAIIESRQCQQCRWPDD